MSHQHRPAKVLMLSTDPGIGWGGTKGASIHLREIATAFAASGVDVTVAVSRVDAVTVPVGVNVVEMPGPGRGASLRDRVAAEPIRTRWLANRVRELGIDMIYERFALHTTVGTRAARRTGVPHFIELNAPLPVEAATFRTLEQPRRAVRCEHEVLSRAARVFAVSDPVASYAATRGAQHVSVLPNAVDPARFQNPTVVDHDPPTAVFVGTLRPWHGIDVLADAWRLLGSRAPRLLVVGDGPGRDRLEAVGATITGSVDPTDVPNHLSLCQIGLAPYPADGPSYFSPLKVFEYLGAGLATIAADIPGVVDVMDHNTGIVIPRGDPESLASAVDDLVRNPELRRSLGHAGRVHAMTNHTWAQRVDEILSWSLAPTRPTFRAALTGSTIDDSTVAERNWVAL